ncbi:hypothetical protein GOA63_15115 [Sinorhizobium meliloti]|uniref:ComEC/Rec2 family competence protein n=1 Tax=Rhizobium meliloti TaxID=382 RepID=UPI001294B9F2|nr:hypothetical protein [Sinorhizobium meliloti]MDW9593537.1 hypothetical protein [Sinorhizobium meliloti]MDX0191715.1 hypothetical protein [Sinorhizobium meliloti]MQV09059.1 hypothetical protein [Sinorhizobium meliloti]
MFRITVLPAEDGDCLFVETGARPHRILIDGGRSKTARGPLTFLLDGLQPRTGAAIDLMVLSHVDADHIEGVLDILETRTDIAPGNIWFNGLNACRVADGKSPLTRKPVGTSVRQTQAPILSALQGEKFSQSICEKNWAWNKGWKDAAVMVEPDEPLPTVELDGGARLILLGPTRSSLAALRSEWERTVRKEIAKEMPGVLGGKRGAAHLPGRAAEFYAAKRDEPDDAVPNGSSITFVLECDGKRALFAADAHPDDLATALERYQPGGGRICFDAIKVAHHGSAANNTSPLLARLQSPLWLVSSNGSRHGHPDPEAIARIVLTPAAKRLVFNYHSEYSDVWNDELAGSAYNYTCQFPVENGDCTVIDLDSDCLGIK